MQDLPLSLEGLKREDAFAVASALLYSLKGVPKYSIISELFYILDYENFLKLIKYYGGMEIRIPTVEEISDLLKCLLLYQYYVVENLDWEVALTKSGYSLEDTASAKMKLNHLIKILKTQEIGGRDYK